MCYLSEIIDDVSKQKEKQESDDMGRSKVKQNTHSPHGINYCAHREEPHLHRRYTSFIFDNDSTQIFDSLTSLMNDIALYCSL